MEYEKGDLVWFDPGLGYVLPGEVIEFHRAGQVITVQALIGGKTQVFTLTNLSSLRRRQDLGENGTEDMISLGDLNEASLLWNLKIRYDNEQIYTYTGSILVSVNPYRMFDIYGLDVVKKYEGKILGTLSPHIFAIGSSAYTRMSKDNSSQCVVISGESGAGKTEATKLVMQYLAAVNKSQSNLITEQILEASPLLESFGNAKTIKNDNSSRFGKYLECFFKDGIITGAKITEYLLEKSRIVTQASDERNYHVFYEMLAGLTKEKKAKYGLTTPDKYFYLNQGESCELPNKLDGDDFQALLSAMQVLGFPNDEQDTIFRILASVLHLGNVYYHRKPLRHGQEGVEVGSEAEVKWASHLLQLDKEGIRRALTTKITDIRHERVSTPLNIDQALDSRDAIAKALYSALFSWLVKRVNLIIHKGVKKTCISILDIFGFEDFKENSFEQLCINYANEKLQYYFNQHIFKIEQHEYAKEKIEWQNIDFQDNFGVLDLISRKPVGILHLLDDESNFPKATDVSFLEKCHYNHALNELYSRPRMSSMEFGVRHFAGRVWYNVDGFLDKNRDTLRNDVVELLISSKLPMLSEMFMDVRIGSESKTLNKANGRFITMKPRTPTVAARFNDSLSALVESMNRANPWFIRCIKPNNEKAALKLDMPLVLEQLRYTGMLETITIRQQGYPIRLKFLHFADRYRCLVPGKVPKGAPAKEICLVVLDRSAIRASSRGRYQMGVSKVFMKEHLEKVLEQERYKKLSHAVVTIQRHTRGLLARKKYNSFKRSAVIIQAWVRMYQTRHRFNTLRRGVVKAQAIQRGRTARRLFMKMKEEAARRKKLEEMSKQRNMRQNLQKENVQAERAQRTVAGVNHLEVPADLAYIFSKTAEWTGPYRTQGYISRILNTVPCDVSKSYIRLPHDLDYYAFTKYTNVYFKSHLWGMKREPIKTPFLPKHRDADYADSLAFFKLILRFMNDATLTGTKETILGNYIANKGIQNERMRDEILCQLSNQTWHNENVANLERGWLLMANCLSVFPPSQSLYKYLLKYVSDHGYDGYANLCQKKLLSVGRSSGLARNFGPTELEWRANRSKSRMALSALYPDGKIGTAEIDSWTTGEEFCSTLLQQRGIDDSFGWSVSLNENDALSQISFLDYVLDIVGQREVPSVFNVVNNSVLFFDKESDKRMPVSHGRTNVLDESTAESRRISSPPPLTRKLSREALAAHDYRGSGHPSDPGEIPQRGDEKGGTIGLSRTSALNNRYFDDKTKSRSMDNLNDNAEKHIQDLGLSPSSKLNERYHSMDQLTEPGPDPHSFLPPDFDNMESVSQRGAHVAAAGPESRHGKGLEGSKMWSKYPLVEGRNVPEEPTNVKDYPKVLPSRFVKANNRENRRNYPNNGNTRGYMERDYVRSSAMSDTSETPSLASHVRRVRVPSQASDVDQFLDDLFMPVLDQQLDELSDARSLAASIKGGRKKRDLGSRSALVDKDNVEINSADMLDDLSVSSSLENLTDTKKLTEKIKGGGYGPSEVETSPPKASVGAPVVGMYPGSPMAQGMPYGSMSPTPMYSSSDQLDSSQISAYQQNVQRAFLESAVAQNIQIQQHLMAQNQALQHLIHQSVPAYQESPVPEKIRSKDPHNRSSRGGISPPPPLPLGSPFQPGTAGLSFHQAMAASSPVPDQKKMFDSRRDIFDRSGNSSQPYQDQLIQEAMEMGGVPPPPPMPEMDAAGNYLDPYQRAKTVRIGKWRWPPPKGEEESGASTSFLHFKMKKRSSKPDGKENSKSNSRDDSVDLEWTEFEMSENVNSGPVAAHLTPTVAENKLNKLNSLQTESYSPQLFLMQKQHYKKNEKISPQQGNGIAKAEKTPKNEIKRKDSWDSDINEEAAKENSDNNEGIGKLKIPREMRQKLEALTSTNPSGHAKGASEVDKGVKKLESTRRSRLQQQLEGSDQWGVGYPRGRKPPSPIIPMESRGGHLRGIPSPDPSISSQETSPVVPHKRAVPPGLKAHHAYAREVTERRGSISTVQTEKTEHFEIEERGEFLKSVDTAPRLKDEEKEKKNVESMKTRLLPPLQGAHLAYAKVPWQLTIRKELFSPNETLSAESLHLVFCQVVFDVFSGSASDRLSHDEICHVKKLLCDYGVTPNNTFSSHHKRATKNEIVEVVKTFPLYFASIFPVSGCRKIELVEYLAVSHHGIRILQRVDSHFKIIETYRLSDIEEAKCSRTGSLHLFLSNGSGIVLYLNQAQQVANILTNFLSLIHAGSREFVRAIADYVTREPTLLSFRKGDVIRLAASDSKYPEKGWVHGILDGRTGLFPVEYVASITRNEARLTPKVDPVGVDPGLVSERKSTHSHVSSRIHLDQSSPINDSHGNPTPPWLVSKTQSGLDDSGHSGGHSSGAEGTDDPQKTSVDDGKHSLFQFALQEFRGAKESGVTEGSLQVSLQKNKKKKGSKEEGDWTWKDLVELVKFSQSPLKTSLLTLEGDLNILAVETFVAVMRYMGDYPMDPHQTEVHCVYFILMNCHKHEALRDEVYCQVMKQTTNNKSSIPDSCQRGWRMFSIIAAYFTCSQTLKPYLLKYLETNAYDKRRAFHGTAMVCLQNIRKTFRYGGRKNVPSIEEITAITAGRNSKRQIYRLPGGTERVINTKSTSVVQDILEELCNLINVRSADEQEEFSLYCIVEGDAFTMPLAREEYVLDVTTELLKNKQIFYLVFCRSVFYYPLRMDNGLYIEVVFNQIAPDYLAGFLLITPGEHLDQDIIYDVAKISALMHRAADLDHTPTIKEVKYLLPRPLLKARDVKPPAWVSLVQSSWPEALTLSSMEAKAAVLEILQKWPLFGSAFFDVERMAEPEALIHTILALNKRGVHFLDPNTHESIITFPLDKILSTRKIKGNDTEMYLDMKCGNLMKPRIITLKTNQAHEISRQIRQYITIEQRYSGVTQEDHPRDVTLTR